MDDIFLDMLELLGDYIYSDDPNALRLLVEVKDLYRTSGYISYTDWEDSDVATRLEIMNYDASWM